MLGRTTSGGPFGSCEFRFRRAVLVITLGSALFGAAVVFSPFVVRAEFQALSQVRFLQNGVERTDVGELNYVEGGIQLRLFSQKLAGFYVLHLTPEDLLEISFLSDTEAREIQDARLEAKAKKDREREADRQRRRAEKAKQREAERKRNTKAGRKSRPDKRSSRDEVDPEEGRVVKVKLPPPEETIDALEETFAGIDKRMKKLRDLVKAALGRLDALDRKSAGSVRRDVLGFEGQLDDVAEKIQRRRDDVESMKSDTADGFLTAALAIDRAEMAYRRLRPVEQRLVEAESRGKSLVGRVSTVVESRAARVDTDGPELSVRAQPEAGHQSGARVKPPLSSSKARKSSEVALSAEATENRDRGRSLDQSAGALGAPRAPESAASPIADRASHERTSKALETEVVSSPAEENPSRGIYWLLGIVCTTVLVIFVLAVRSMGGSPEFPQPQTD